MCFGGTRRCIGSQHGACVRALKPTHAHRHVPRRPPHAWQPLPKSGQLGVPGASTGVCASDTCLLPPPSPTLHPLVSNRRPSTREAFHTWPPWAWTCRGTRASCCRCAWVVADCHARLPVHIGSLPLEAELTRAHAQPEGVYRPRFKLETRVIRVPIVPGSDPRQMYGVRSIAVGVGVPSWRVVDAAAACVPGGADAHASPALPGPLLARRARHHRGE